MNELPGQLKPRGYRIPGDQFGPSDLLKYHVYVQPTEQIQMSSKPPAEIHPRPLLLESAVLDRRSGRRSAPQKADAG